MYVTRVNSINILDEGLRIGGKGRRMNWKVEVSQTRCDYACIENKRSNQLAQSQSVPGRPLLAPIYRWPYFKDPVGFNKITMSVYEVISYFDYVYDWAYLNGPQGYKDNELY
jgi:hypothetical protein